MGEDERRSGIHKSLVSGKSSGDFSKYAWPVIRSGLGGGQLLTVEGNELDDFKFHLDRIAGIDAWQVNVADGKMRGLACRVQYVSRAFESFSVRKKSGKGETNKTEYDKRQTAINSHQGLVYPYLTCQAYLFQRPLARPELLAVAVCETHVLISLCQRHHETKFQVNKKDGSEFYVVNWSVFEKLNLPLLVLGSKVEAIRTEFFKI